MTKTTFTVSDDKKSLTVERVFNASQDSVWEAYTTKELLDKWFAPNGWECTTKSHEFSEGGAWVYLFKCVDEEQSDFFGMEIRGKLVYDDINPKDSFGYTDQFLDEDGNIDESMPNSHTVVRFNAEDAEKVHLVSTTTYVTAEALQQVLEMGMQDGLSESYDKLDELLGGN